MVVVLDSVVGGGVVGRRANATLWGSEDVVDDCVGEGGVVVGCGSWR